MKVYKNLDLRKNQLQNAVIHNVSALPDVVDSIAGQLVYLTLIDGSNEPGLYYFDGVKWVGSSEGSDTNGFAFISNITPQDTVNDNVGGKEYQDDFEQVLTECVSDTTSVRIHFIASANNLTYKPILAINNTPVPANQVVFDNDKPIFVGTFDIELIDESSPGVYPVIISSNGGSIFQAEVNIDVAPVIQTAVFTGGYPTFGAPPGYVGPTTQTELKAGDAYNFQVTADIPFVAVQFDGASAYATTAVTRTVSSTTNATLTGGQAPVIANRGTTTQNLPARVRVQKATGTWSDWFVTDSVGTTDGTHRVALNNTLPTTTAIVQGNITYPIGQAALKNSETATVACTLTNVTWAFFDSPNSELSVTDPNTIANTKTVTRIAGSYNVSTNNYRVQAWRIENFATATLRSVPVFIANIAPTINITTPAARLRSGGNDGTSAQNHTITIVSSQNLASVSALDASIGTFIGSWSGTPNTSTSWTRSLQIHDNDDKGAGAFSNLLVTNMAGITQTVITSGASYTAGGFVARTLTVPGLSSSPSQPTNWEIQMNVAATQFGFDNNKLTATWSWPQTLPTVYPFGTITWTGTDYGWSIEAVNTNGAGVRILHPDAVNVVTNPSTLVVEEVV